MDPKTLIPIVAQVTLILVVASVGLRAQWSGVVEEFGNWRKLWRAIVAVNVVVPLAALAMCALLPIGRSERFGLVIIAVSPLAPLLTGKAMRAGLDASRTVGSYVMLVLASVLIVPATVALLSQMLPPDVSISVGAVARLVAISVLLPLGAGLAVANWFPHIAEKLAGPIAMAGYVILTLIALPILWTQGSQIFALIGNGTVLAMAVTVIAGLAAGHYLAGPELVEKRALALAAATRHPGIAALIVNANFPDNARLMLVVMLFVAVSVIASFGYLQLSKDRTAAGSTAAPAK